MSVHDRNDEQFVPYVDHDIASHQVKTVSFRVYNDAELRKLCVKQLHDSETFDCLGHAISGGLYDLELGRFFATTALYWCTSVKCYQYTGLLLLALLLKSTFCYYRYSFFMVFLISRFCD